MFLRYECDECAHVVTDEDNILGECSICGSEDSIVEIYSLECPNCGEYSEQSVIYNCPTCDEVMKEI